MAPNDDVLLSESEKSDRGEEIGEKKYKCCAGRSCKTLFCRYCKGAYHSACAIRKNFKIMEGGELVCCEPEQSESELLNGEDKYENEKLRMQVGFLNRLLTELEEKNWLLNENNTLLRQRIEFLENSQGENMQGRKTYPVTVYQSQKQKVGTKNAEHQVAEKVENVNIDRDRNSGGTRSNQASRSDKDVVVMKERRVTDKTDDVFNIVFGDDNNKVNKKRGPEMKDDRNYAGRVRNAVVENEVMSDGFQEVKYKKRRYVKKRIGTGNVTQEENQVGFSGADRKVWLNIYRVKKHVTENMIVEYIKKQAGFEGENVEVKELLTASKATKSFLVTASFKKKDKMYDPDFWPENVGIRRFKPELHRKNEEGNFL